MKHVTPDLIDRLERSTGDDARDLDDEIFDIAEPFHHHAADIPHYTTSLEAKLPGENIVQVTAPYLDTLQRGLWTAQQLTDDDMIIGKGHTEALARRVAALKAREPTAKEGE